HRAIVVVRREALSIDEDERALLTEIAQVNGCGSRVAIVGVIPKGLGELRPLPEEVLQVDRVTRLDFCLADYIDRRVGGYVGPLDSRAGDDDFLKLGVVLRQARWRSGSQKRTHG